MTKTRPGGYEDRKESKMKGSEKQVRWATEMKEFGIKADEWEVG